MSDRRRMWLSIVKRYEWAIREFEQIIRDTNYWNGLPHNQMYTPLDVEIDRVAVSKLKQTLADFRARNPEPEV